MPSIPRNPRAIGIGLAGVLALAAPLVMKWEGLRHTPYADVGGVPTVCYGHAHSVQDRRYTDAECKALLDGDLAIAYGAVTRCITHPLTNNQAAAFTDAAYNIGPRVVCGSSLQRLANAGDLAGACRQLLRWDRVGGQKVRGLTRRREAEYRMCMGVP